VYAYAHAHVHVFESVGPFLCSYLVQEAQLCHHSGHKPKQRSQAEDGKHVGGVDDEGVQRDTKHSGNGVYGKHYV
jgi:hypothetical protein